MSTDATERTTWWILFPISGLTLTDRLPDLATPLFGDATLLSTRHIYTLQRRRGRGQHVFREWEAFLSLSDTMSRSIACYLAVCRSSTEHIGEDDRAYAQVVMQAKARAEQVLAALAVLFLSQRPDGRTCGLRERVYDRRQLVAAMDSDAGFTALSMSPATHARILSGYHDQMITTSRREIRQLARQPLYRGIQAAVLTIRSPLARSLRTSLTQACVSISDALSSPRLSAQLLGSVTALENILTFTDQVTGYGNIEQRTTALLGAPLTAQLQLPRVLQARHAFVHQGRTIDSPVLVAQALTLATAALLVASSGSHHFYDKNALVAYLDVVSKQSSIRRADEQRGPLVRIAPVFAPLPPELPLFAHVDRATMYEDPERFYHD